MRTAATPPSPLRPPRSSSKRGAASAPNRPGPPLREPALIVACGALAAELRAVLPPGSAEVRYLPAHFHNRPERIVPALAPILDEAAASGRTAFVAYADCGTGGALDRLLADHPGVERLPGAHCYELFAGAELFATLHDDEPGTFFLTDFLTRHFEPLVWQGLGLDRHPELRDVYFAHYRRRRAVQPVRRSRARRRRSSRRGSPGPAVRASACRTPSAGCGDRRRRRPPSRVA